MNLGLEATPRLGRVRAALGSDAVRDCAAIAIVAVLIAAVLRPFQNTPFIDDWAYSWSVQHLLDTHELLFPEIVGNADASQVVWGALFCLPYGFSLATLRLSTWVLGVLALWALYLLVREGGGSRRGALTAAAVLGFYPVFFVLLPTFMTDVPALAGILWSMFLFVRAVHQKRVALVWLAAAVCAISVCAPVISLGVAGAMIATLLFHTGRWGRRMTVLLAPVLVGLFAAWLFVWTRAHVFTSADITWVNTSVHQRMANLRYAVGPMLPSMILETLLFALELTGIALIPIAAGLVRRAIVRRSAFLLALLAGVWLAARMSGYAAWIPFEPRALWALREVGAVSSLIPGWQAPPLPSWAAVGGVVVALVSAAILAAVYLRGPLGAAAKFLWWNIAGQVLFVAVVWLTYDRYVLVFVPLVATLVLVRRPTQHLVPTVAGLALYALISLVGTRDHLAYNHAVWSAVADLQAQGIPVADIDGGYVVNGWLQYLHPDEAYRDPSGRIVVPMVNDVAELTYTVADRPLPNRTIVRTYPYDRWLQPGGEIYVLKR